MSLCRDCMSVEVELTEVSIAGITLRTCKTCERVVGLGPSTASTDGFRKLMKTEPAQPPQATPPTVTQADGSVQLPSIYIIQPAMDIVEPLKSELGSIRGVAFHCFRHIDEALGSMSDKIKSGASLRAVLLNPDAAHGSGAMFLYGLRALEMVYGSGQVPVLLVGTDCSADLSRAMEDVKNTRFISLGTVVESDRLCDRYAKIAKKLVGA